MKDVDVTIIGAGLIGLSTAHALSARGVSVRVIETKAAPMRGASFSNSGMVHPSQARTWSPVPSQSTDAASACVLDLARRSAELLRENFAAFGLKDAQSRPPACLQIYPDFDAAHLAQADFAQMGISADIVVDPVQSFGHTALRFAEDFSANSYDYGMALARKLSERRVDIIYSVKNLAFRPNDNGLRVRADLDNFTSENVVIAAGVGSKAILAALGLGLRVRPVRGFAINYARPDMALPDAPLMDFTSRTALSVFGNQLRLSGGWDAQADTALTTRWEELAPDLMAALPAPQSRWTGERPVSAAGRPFIGPAQIKGLWVNTGHGHMGWTLCAGSGALMADMIVDGACDARFAYEG